jgi:glycosyltransferase involved in cell wall biosynthesis
MALQKPIVASTIGWAKEVVEAGEEGFLVHPQDHKRYAERILELLESIELQKSLGIAARKKVVDKFSMEVVAQQSVLFYRKLIK